MVRFRLGVLTLLALAVPTFAFGGEEGPAGPQSLSVSASLGGCGLANAAIVCQIDTGWNSLEGADYYTVSVTRPDGSVLDLGQGAGAGRTLFVPYVGSGSYSVQVAAWGTPPGEEEPEVLAREQALSTEDGDDERGAVGSKPNGSVPAGDGRDVGEAGGSAEDEVGAVTEPAEPGRPACEEEPADDKLDEDDKDEDAEVAREPAAADELTAEDEADDEAEDEAEDPRPVCP